MIAPSPPTRVLVAGSLTIDRIEVGGTSRSRLGGVVTYASLTFARHDLVVDAVFQVPDGDRWAVRRLAEHRVHVSPGSSPTATRFVHRIVGDDREQWMPSAACPIPAERVDASMVHAGHLHLGPLHPEDLDPRIFELPALNHATVSIDIQGYVRGLQGSRVVEAVDDRLRQALRSASCVKASEQELALVCAAWGLDEAELVDAFELEAIIVTSGSRGGHVRSRSGEVTRFEPSMASKIVDTTGAGDVFFAAWLARRVHQGATVEQACVHAAWVAARHVEGLWLPAGVLDADEAVGGEGNRGR